MGLIVVRMNIKDKNERTCLKLLLHPQPEPLCDIEQMTGVSVKKEDDNISLKVEVALKDPDKENLTVTLEERDAEELVLVLQGYYFLLAEKGLLVQKTKDQSHSDQGRLC